MFFKISSKIGSAVMYWMISAGPCLMSRREIDEKRQKQRRVSHDPEGIHGETGACAIENVQERGTGQDRVKKRSGCHFMIDYGKKQRSAT